MNDGLCEVQHLLMHHKTVGIHLQGMTQIIVWLGIYVIGRDVVGLIYRVGRWIGGKR